MKKKLYENVSLYNPSRLVKNRPKRNEKIKKCLVQKFQDNIVQTPK